MKKYLLSVLGIALGAQFFSALMNAVNDCIPIYEPGSTLTMHCAAAVTGKRFVKITADAQGGGFQGLDDDALGGNIVGTNCTAIGERALGVANRDAALNGKVGVLCTPGLVVPILAGAAIVAWNEVMTDATGKAIPYAEAAGRVALGVAIADAANATDAPIRLYGTPVRHPA